MNIFQRIKNVFKFQQNNNFFGGLGVAQNYLEINSKQDILTAYFNTPTLKAIVDRKAEVFSNFVIKELNSKGEELKNTPFLNVINNPHPLYSKGEFWQTISKQWDLFDEIYLFIIRKNSSIGGTLKNGDAILILNGADLIPIINPNFNPIELNSQPILYYNYNINNSVIQILPYDVIHIAKTSLSNTNFATADLSLESCEGAINSIISAYNVRNTLYRRNGGFGIFSNDAKSGEFYNNEIEKEEKDRIQNDLKQYSFNRNEYNYIITSANLKYQPITYPIAEMQLSEGILQAKKDLCDVLNYPILSLNELEGSTYSNMEISNKKLYTDAIIPLWKIIESSFNTSNLTVNTIKFDYSNVEATFENKQIDLQNQQLNDQIQASRYTAGLISLDEYKIAIGL